MIFNKKKLQQLWNILIYIQDRNSIQIITCRRSMKKRLSDKGERLDFAGMEILLLHLIISTRNRIGESICIRKVYRALPAPEVYTDQPHTDPV